MMKFDLWNGHKLCEVSFADCFFYPQDTVYRGNLYNKEREIIGDFTADNSVIVEKHFPGIFGN